MKAGSALVATTAMATPKQTRIGASVMPSLVRRSQMRPARKMPIVLMVIVEMPST